MIRLLNRIMEKRIRDEAMEILRNAPAQLNLQHDIPTKLISVEKNGTLIEQYIETDRLNYINYRYGEMDNCYGKVNNGKFVKLLRDLSEKNRDNDAMKHEIKVTEMDSMSLKKLGETHIEITFIPFKDIR